MIDGGSWGHLYSAARGEILGFAEDKLLRKHLPKMRASVKHEEWGVKNDQIPL